MDLAPVQLWMLRQHLLVHVNPALADLDTGALTRRLANGSANQRAPHAGKRVKYATTGGSEELDQGAHQLRRFVGAVRFP